MKTFITQHSNFIAIFFIIIAIVFILYQYKIVKKIIDHDSSINFDNGDPVIAIRHSTGEEVVGIVTRKDNHESYIVLENGDGFYCSNKNIKPL